MMFSSCLAAGELLEFAEKGLRLTAEKRPGSEHFSIEKSTVAGGAPAINLCWNPGVPAWVETALLKSSVVIDFSEAEFFVNAELPAEHNITNMTLRFVDAGGETFQYPTDFKSSLKGSIRVRATVDTRKLNKNSFGGNKDGKVELPLRFSGLVCGIANTAKPGGILLRSVDYRVLNSEHLTFSFVPGHPLSVILPGTTEKPALLFRNTGTEAAEVSGTLKVQDADGQTTDIPVVFTLPPEEKFHLEIPLRDQKFGVRHLDCQLESRPSGKLISSRMQFALMKPFEERGRRETFLFGSAGPTGPTGALAQQLTGVKNNRGNPGWVHIQPREGVWDFAGHDRFVEGCLKRGVQIQYVISPPPAWAVAKDYQPKDPARKGWKRPDYEAFREFIDRLSQRYKGRIAYYIVGNEPDLINFCNFSEDEYIRMLKIAYTTIKKNDPAAQVMSGGISSLYSQVPRSNNSRRHNNTILQKLLSEGRPYYDVFAFHGHGATAAYLEQLKELRAMGAIGKDKKWISEETGATSSVFGEKGQAIVLFQKLILSWVYGASGLDWYNFYDLGNDPLNWEHRYGILTHANQPKPAFLTYATVTDLLYGGAYLSSPVEEADLHIHEFRSAEQSFIYPFWSMSAKKHLILISGVTGTVAVSDIFHNETEPAPRNDSLLLKAGPIPEALIIKQEQPPVVEGRIFTGEECSVVAGEARNFTFTLRNPLKKELNAELAFTPPKGVAGGGQRALRVPAGKSASVTIPLHPGKEFKSYTAAPAQMSIRLNLPGIGTESIDWDVISNIIIANKRPESPTFILDRQDQVTTYAVSGPENHLFWQGKDDLSAKAWLYQTGKSLILEVQVTDDVHIQNHQGAAIWQGDSVQFVLSLPNQDKPWTFGLARLADGKPQVWCWTSPRGSVPDEAAKNILLNTERNEVEKTTIYRTEIPFQSVGLNENIGKRGFRFNLLINDNDGDKRKNCIRVIEGIEHSAAPFNYPFVSFQ